MQSPSGLHVIVFLATKDLISRRQCNVCNASLQAVPSSLASVLPSCRPSKKIEPLQTQPQIGRQGRSGPRQLPQGVEAVVARKRWKQGKGNHCSCQSVQQTEGPRDGGGFFRHRGRLGPVVAANQRAQSMPSIFSIVSASRAWEVGEVSYR